jgi:hypothetical protein
METLLLTRFMRTGRGVHARIQRAQAHHGRPMHHVLSDDLRDILQLHGPHQTARGSSILPHTRQSIHHGEGKLGESAVESRSLQFPRRRNTTKDVFRPVRMGPMLLTCRWVQSLGGEHMKELVRISVVSALVVMAQVALADSPAAPPRPRPVPPILQPHPGPVGPSGPVDPTPVDPPS